MSSHNRYLDDMLVDVFGTSDPVIVSNVMTYVVSDRSPMGILKRKAVEIAGSGYDEQRITNAWLDDEFGIIPMLEGIVSPFLWVAMESCLFYVCKRGLVS